ncbi:MAG: head GIN domain-containing protein [Bacteroidota bacterium]
MRNLFFFLLALLLFQSFTTAQSWWDSGMNGEGARVERTLDLPEFWGITNTMKADVYLTQGATQSVTVQGQANIVDQLVLEVENGIWKIKPQNRLRRYDKLTINITVPKMTYVAVSGSGDIYTSNAFRHDGAVTVTASGAGNIQFATTASDVDVRISGSSDIRLEGSASSINARISGSGDLMAADFVVAECEIRVSGSGDVEIHANNRLDARVSGSGDVSYRGQPKVYSRVSGSGNVSAM